MIFSVSLLVSRFDYDVPWKLRNLLANKLPDEIDIDKKGDIPTICFSLSTFTEKELENTEYKNLI